jgi:hypothetical protein
LWRPFVLNSAPESKTAFLMPDSVVIIDLVGAVGRKK